MNPTILIISAFDPLPGEGRELIRYPLLAEALTEKGADVRYITSDFDHFSKKKRQAPPYQLPYQIHYIPTPPYKKNIGLGRLYNHHIFARRLIRFLKKNEIQADGILSAFPPISANMRLSKWADEREIPFFVDVQDLWPEAFGTKIPPSLRGALLKSWKANRNKIMDRSTQVFAVSEDYLKLLDVREKGIPIPLGTSFPESLATNPQNPGRTKLILLAGSDRLPFLPALLTEFEKLPLSFQLSLVGRSQYFQGKPSEGRISYHHDVSEERKRQLLSEADIGLVINDPDLFSRLPNKLFSYLRYGLALISNLKGGEMEELLEKEQWGQGCAADLTDLSGTIMRLAADDGPKSKQEIFLRAKMLFDKKTLYESYAEYLLNQIASK